jgi:hypothetical protein
MHHVVVDIVMRVFVVLLLLSFMGVKYTLLKTMKTQGR